MTPTLKIVVGLLCALLGMGYLYRPDLIERMNAVLRDYILNDAYIALERRKWGMFFLLVSFLFLYMGWAGLGR
ncbi:MAG: hypothetical protein COV48_14975 [Elusimicrobia bacterium CG11_big_fil_rev_8_21_14_0_20_64_6]|nr:MAG: hypothetical protein COV48_14975 [Elusimicrobia bacterium CG11_big_fil_rev_8_21_14_0_20_64_6]